MDCSLFVQPVVVVDVGKADNEGRRVRFVLNILLEVGGGSARAVVLGSGAKGFGMLERWEGGGGSSRHRWRTLGDVFWWCVCCVFEGRARRLRLVVVIAAMTLIDTATRTDNP